ncbi:hypothetical protein KFL_000360070 [Klebsormidium nitens]|uniref:Uncharacterized protein n=1 Tax=Klebsormidium nitens TaxID=105231 RepID=A0A1Y1HRS5_KLENI|nr:hypothetical protein KFL_000360070 [Klebsormidium nitens]|eukprot:GAQ79691.1 hypothetical protein KFL_000360070 [Klebsormidium nitens]
MEVCFRVMSQPDSSADFLDELHLVMEKERFILPIKTADACEASFCCARVARLHRSKLPSLSMCAQAAAAMEVPTVTVSQIANFPVDSDFFQVHGKIVDLDSPTQNNKPKVRELPFGHLFTTAAVFQDKEGNRITVEATSRDKHSVEYVSDKCAKESTILLYRPTVASCRYSLTDHPTSLKVTEGRTMIMKSEEEIVSIVETPVSFDALQPGGVHKIEGLLVYKSRVCKPMTSRGDREVVKIVIKDKSGIMGSIAIWGDMAHLPELKQLKVRADVVVISGVQYDEDQGCSSTRNTVICKSDASAAAVAAIGLTYRIVNEDRIMPWSRVVQSLAGNKWTAATVLATFINFTKVDSIAYGCYECSGAASRNPVTRQLFCEQGCQPGPLTDACVEVTVSVDIRVDAGPDVLAVKIWSNDFVVVTGTHLTSFSIKPPNEQLDNLNTRLKNKRFAMHLRIRENPNTQFSQYQANIVGIELPPEKGFFSKKYKAE